MPDKIVVTNEAALRGKYGAAGLTAIRKAVKALIAADQTRGLDTVLIALDSAAAMKKVGGQAVTSIASTRQNKEAIDAIARKHAPDYLLILGAPDVVPHQDLKNPLFGPDDDDKLAWGDLPYACEAPYSTKPEHFAGPARVVGRLPDLAGATDPAYLLDLLKTAAGYTRRPASDYAPAYFGITAEVWKGSTAMSLRNLFGASAKMQSIPPKTKNWPAAALAPRSHFINCHGAAADYRFYGQRGESYPDSLDAKLLGGKITEGTVAAAECCYGAELYDPALAAGQAGICSTYLREGAYGFFGSTTIAYGPSDGNGLADLICQYFLGKVMAGASLGRAALEARQQFVMESGHLDPAELKTLAQFNLLGDPSLTPVSTPAPHSAATGKAMRAAAAAPAAADGVDRRDRRRKLMARGAFLAETSPHVNTTAKKQAGPALLMQLMKLGKAAGIREPHTLGFAVSQPAAQRKSLTKARLAKSPVPDSCHVVMGSTAPASPKRGAKPTPAKRIKALVANVSGGKVTGVREYVAR